MKKTTLIASLVAIMVSAGSVMAHPISLTVNANFGLWSDTFGGTLLPAGAYYQIWWSTDSAYLGGNAFDTPTANLGTGGQAYGDYVVFSGNTPNAGGWSTPAATGTLTDAMVGGNTISDGYVYGVVYDGTPEFGDQYLLTQIYGPSWGNAGSTPPPTPDNINFAPTQNAGVMGDSVNFVVPEPGTMALFGLGLLTIAARRRRQAA